VFKHALKDRFIVCRVVYRLSKAAIPNLGYGDLENRVREQGEVTLKTIRESVLSIRNIKLPDPDVFGNAGSFFTNPILPIEVFNQLKQDYPGIPGWDLGDGRVKIPAAWCIEQTGWKGRELGGAGVHPNQPLVLINRGTATASDLIRLAESIQADVLAQFGVTLKPEVLYV
jgi:UDP-N-acetylmuramate dehydrogenase